MERSRGEHDDTCPHGGLSSWHLRLLWFQLLWLLCGAGVGRNRAILDRLRSGRETLLHGCRYDHTKGCTGMFRSCGKCKNCCSREHAVAKCRCDRLVFNEVCKKNAAAACQKCKELCVGLYVETCNDGSTACM